MLAHAGMQKLSTSLFPPLGNGRHFPRPGVVLRGQSRPLTPAEQLEEAGNAQCVFDRCILSEPWKMKGSWWALS